MSFDPQSYLDPELYDLAYSWYTPDIDYYVAQARQANGPVLEVGCGTGRVYLPSLAAGADIDGLDLHPGMLEVLKRKAESLGLKPRVRVADMCDFTMPRRYPLITIPFRAFMHVIAKADQIRALRCIREHLEPDGRLVFDLFYPSFDAIVNPGHPVHADREIPDPAGGRRWVLHVTAVETSRVRQVIHSEREFQELDGDGKLIDAHPHRFEMRWTWRYEMELLLDKAGFSRYQVEGGFDGRPLANDTDQMVWTAWR
jgi:SAM-dependent methyltransferase